MCLHELLIHAYTHVFVFIYSVRLTGCLFHGGKGEGGLGTLFFIYEGPWSPFYEFLEATLRSSTLSAYTDFMKS